MAGGGGGDGKTPTLNVVSMVDVIFNVIVFFILTAKAANEEMAKVFVPKVDKPAVTAIPEQTPRLVVTILFKDDDKKFAEMQKSQRVATIDELIKLGPTGAPEFVQVGVKKVNLSDRDAPQQITNLIKEAAKQRNAISIGPDGKEVNKLEVMVRANMAAPYSYIQPTWAAIMAAGVSKANLMTLTGQ